VKARFFIVSILLFPYLKGQTNLYQWHNDTTEAQIVYQNFSATSVGLIRNDSNVDNGSILNSFLANHKNQGGIHILFDSGTYYFSTTVSLMDSLWIEGYASELIFNSKIIGDLFSLQGLANASKLFTGMAYKNKTYLLAKMALTTGDYYKITQPDSGRITSSWAKNQIGELIYITRQRGDTFFLQYPLIMSYDSTARISELTPVKQVKFSCFSILRQFGGTNQYSNFNLNLAAHVLFENVKSTNCVFAHIGAFQTYNLRVKNCAFQLSHDYGGGGRGYGVALSNSVCHSYIENNYFRKLRHTTLLQSGSCGNVVAYNFMEEPFWSGSFLPRNSAGQITLHGNYAHSNLFEGNNLDNLVIDNSHGINGPGNTFYRNRTKLWGIFMNDGAGDSSNFLFNEVKESPALFALTGKGNVSLGNKISGVQTDFGDSAKASLYLNAKPTYLQAIPWPAVGNKKQNWYTTAVEESVKMGDTAACQYRKILANVLKFKEDQLLVFPNPAFDQFTLDFSGHLVVINSQGKLILDELYTRRTAIACNHWPAGVYQIVLYGEQSVKKAKIVLSLNNN
jgi:hypothetical protein